MPSREFGPFGRTGSSLVKGRAALIIRSMVIPVALAVHDTPAAMSQTPADSAAISAVALDYIEGWYTGDEARMEGALHSHLAKRYFKTLSDGSVVLTDTSALELVRQVRRGGGSGVPPNDRRTEVTILDVFQDVASVRVDAHGWIDYMHVGVSDGQWKIVNVLWEVRDSS